MKKALLLFLFLFIVSTTCLAQWRIDAQGENMPFNFRTMKDPWHREVTGTAPSREKMAALRISASAQPTKAEFANLANMLRTLAKQGPIYVVDLRQESHGFADNYSVYNHAKRNLANYGKTTPEVIALENNEIKLLLRQKQDFIFSGKNGTTKKEKITITPSSATTEANVAKSVGLRYVRFACPDQMRPDDATIDEFLTFVKSLPKNSWLHFHCQSGHGRTTTFLTFTEILANPKLPLETIVTRQYLLGGTDLLAPVETDGWKDKERLRRSDMIRKFYQYANELDDGKTNLTWSKWISENNGK